jgi:hypothetical protein
MAATIYIKMKKQSTAVQISRESMNGSLMALSKQGQMQQERNVVPCRRGLPFV